MNRVLPPAALAPLACLLLGTGAQAKPAAAPKSFHWCAPEVEALNDEVCFIDGLGDKAPPEGKRTLVVFLHGMIAKNTDWSWTQERALLRQAKAAGFEAIFPRGVDTGHEYRWPGSEEGQRKHEDSLLTTWKQAIAALEQRQHTSYDEIFVMGFSSGAYYASSLAFRGRLDGELHNEIAFRADGFATFAGGSPGRVAKQAPRAPFYVGVCAKDKQTAGHSQKLAGALAAHGFPSRAEAHPVGHVFSDGHVLRAIRYLRAHNAGKPARSAARD